MQEICIVQDGTCHAVCTANAQCESDCCVTTTINGVSGAAVCAAATNCE